MTTSTSHHRRRTVAGPVEEASDLRVALVRVYRQLRMRAGSGITPSQSSALARIESDGPVRLGTLAELEGTTPATMSRVIDSLADLGLIERVTDPLDGRARLVQLSPEGGALLTDLRRRNTEALRTAIADLDDAERATVTAAIPVLQHLSDLLQAPPRSGG